MLNLLVLGFFQLPDALKPAERLRPVDVAQTLRDDGFRVELTGSEMHAGTAGRGGLKVKLLLAPASWQVQDDPQIPISLIQFHAEIPIGEDDDVARRGESEESKEEFYSPTPHLGRTASLYGTVGTERPLSRKALRETFEAFWRKGADYARRHRGRFENAPESDWSRKTFSDDQTLEYGDTDSVYRAMLSWGFKPQGPLERPDGSVISTFSADDVEFSVSPMEFGWPNTGGHLGFWSTFPLDPQANAAAYVASNPGSRSKLEMSYAGEGWATASRGVEFGRRIRLGDLHREVGKFIADVRRLPRTVISKP